MHCTCGDNLPRLGVPARRNDCGCATFRGAEIWRPPVQAYEPQAALRETCRLPQRHSEQQFHRHAGLNGCIAAGLLSATLPGGRRSPAHPWVKPECQRAAQLEHFVVAGPVQGLAGRRVALVRPPKLSRGIRGMYALTPFGQQCRRHWKPMPATAQVRDGTVRIRCCHATAGLCPINRSTCAGRSSMLLDTMSGANSSSEVWA